MTVCLYTAKQVSEAATNRRTGPSSNWDTLQACPYGDEHFFFKKKEVK